MVVREEFPIYAFGVFLWELISGQPEPKHGERSDLVLFLESIVHFLFTQLLFNCWPFDPRQNYNFKKSILGIYIINKKD